MNLPPVILKKTIKDILKAEGKDADDEGQRFRKECTAVEMVDMQ